MPFEIISMMFMQSANVHSLGTPSDIHLAFRSGQNIVDVDHDKKLNDNKNPTPIGTQASTEALFPNSSPPTHN